MINLLNCIVAENESVSRRGMLDMVQKVKFMNISGTAKDFSEVEEHLKYSDIDLMFIDIDMPGIMGIDVPANNSCQAPLVVFTSSYPRRSLEGSSLRAFDYLVKPVTKESLLMTAEKALDALKMSMPGTRDYFFVRAKGRYVKIVMSEIAYVSGMENYVKIHLTNKKTVVVHCTMKGFLARLDTSRFLMVHKSYIVNFDLISAFTNLHVFLKDFGHIPVGRQFRANIMPRLRLSIGKLEL